MNLTREILFTNRVRVLAEFYTNTFNLQPIGELNDNGIELQAGGALLAFHRVSFSGGFFPRRHFTSRNLVARCGVVDKTSRKTADKEDTGLKLVFGPDDITEERRRLIGLGVKMGPVKRFDNLAFCYGSDPDGISVSVVNRNINRRNAVDPFKGPTDLCNGLA